MNYPFFRLELPCLYTTPEEEEAEELEASLGIKMHTKHPPDIRPVIFYEIDALSMNKNKDIAEHLKVDHVACVHNSDGYYITALSLKEVDKLICNEKLRVLKITT